MFFKVYEKKLRSECEKMLNIYPRLMVKVVYKTRIQRKVVLPPERLMQICLRNNEKREDELVKFGAQYITQVIMKVATHYVKEGKLCTPIYPGVMECR